MQVNVAIIGLDRLGTSFGLALKRYEKSPRAQHSFTIIGSDPRAHPMKTANKMGAIDNFNRAVPKAMANADLVIVNVPFGSVEGLYAQLGPELKPGAVVLDTSVLKQPVIRYAEEFFPKDGQGGLRAYLVGITPIINAAALYTGELEVEGGRADLFDGAEVILTPDLRTPSEAIRLAEDVVALLGGKPHFMDPAEHDGLIAATETLPTLVGAALFYTLSRSEGWTELRRMVNPTLALAVQSLRERGQADLAGPLHANRANVARHLGALIHTLEEVREALVGGDEDQIEAFISHVRSDWEKWDIKRSSGKWEEGRQTEPLPGPFGGFLSMRRRKKDDQDDDED